MNVYIYYRMNIYNILLYIIDARGWHCIMNIVEKKKKKKKKKYIYIYKHIYI